MTERQYDAALARWCVETLAVYRRRARLYRALPWARPMMYRVMRRRLPAKLIRLKRAIDAYEAQSDLFAIVCCQPHYAGGGQHWDAGELYATYHSRTSAEVNLRAVNSGWSTGCWQLRVTPAAERTPLRVNRDVHRWWW